jgi:lysozyme family protein
MTRLILAAKPNGLDIKALSREEAIAIYRRDFWEQIDANVLPPAVAYQLLDSAVNSGIGQSVRFLQRALGVADDGHAGPVTRGALKTADVNDMAMRFLAERLDFMTRLKNWPAHGKGWARRIAQNLRYASEDN